MSEVTSSQVKPFAGQTVFVSPEHINREKMEQWLEAHGAKTTRNNTDDRSVLYLQANLSSVRLTSLYYD